MWEVGRRLEEAGRHPLLTMSLPSSFSHFSIIARTFMINVFLSVRAMLKCKGKKEEAGPSLESGPGTQLHSQLCSMSFPYFLSPVKAKEIYVWKGHS